MRRTYSLTIAVAIALALQISLSTIEALAQSNLDKTEEIILRQMEAMRAGGTTIAGPGFVQIPPDQKESIFFTFGDSEIAVCVTVASVSNESLRVSVGDSDLTTIIPFRTRSVCNTLGSRSRAVEITCPEGATSACLAIWRVDRLP